MWMNLQNDKSISLELQTREKILEEDIYNAKTITTFIPYSTLNLQL